jgi:SHR-binding domain of vacuolar-sorting associated protein 13
VRGEGSRVFGSTGRAADFLGTTGDAAKAKPFMFSYPQDKGKNRARMRIGGSEWSSPQSLDAIGSTYSVSMKSSSERSQMTVGVSVTEGEGKVSPSLLSVYRVIDNMKVQPYKSGYDNPTFHHQKSASRRYQHQGTTLP